MTPIWNYRLTMKTFFLIVVFPAHCLYQCQGQPNQESSLLTIPGQNPGSVSTVPVPKPHVLNSGPVFTTFGVYAPKPYNGDRTDKPVELASPVDPSDQTQNHTAKSEVRKISPPLPPPPEEFRQPCDVDSSFDFPPPPKVFSKSGDYVEFEKKSTQNGPVAETKMMGPKLSGTRIHNRIKIVSFILSYFYLFFSSLSLFPNSFFYLGRARCSSVVRAFALRVMGHRIDPSWWTYWASSWLV